MCVCVCVGGGGGEGGEKDILIAGVSSPSPPHLLVVVCLVLLIREQSAPVRLGEVVCQVQADGG